MCAVVVILQHALRFTLHRTSVAPPRPVDVTAPTRVPLLCRCSATAAFASQPQLALHLEDGARALLQHPALRLGQGHVDRLQRATGAHDAGHGEEHLLLDAVLALDQRGDGHHAPLVAQADLHQVGHHHADGPRGVALETNHLPGAAHHAAVDLAPVLLVLRGPDLGAQRLQAHTAHRDRAPCGHARVTVLAQDVAVHRPRIHAQALRN
mmetsp:Transcript_11336/g.36230  ORF Transcript_11336/g.36230 Transcript_11336/m.36230 type:complete len:209 (+) Transcript_11336:951-1577(+)